MNNNNNALVSISLTFFTRLFCTKVLCEAFLLLQSGFVFFWKKNIDAKADCKMLKKLVDLKSLELTELLQKKKLDLGSLLSRRIHQHYTCAFFVQIFCQSKT
jgi:hypothetical protein